MRGGEDDPTSSGVPSSIPEVPCAALFPTPVMAKVTVNANDDDTCAHDPAWPDQGTVKCGSSVHNAGRITVPHSPRLQLGAAPSSVRPWRRAAHDWPRRVAVQNNPKKGRVVCDPKTRPIQTADLAWTTSGRGFQQQSNHRRTRAHTGFTGISLSLSVSLFSFPA